MNKLKFNAALVAMLAASVVVASPLKSPAGKQVEGRDTLLYLERQDNMFLKPHATEPAPST
ncbi:hypothetical protein M413DRAFT_30311 [Hebeloma cylindrosporum]|uniref:Uncharacterized protein n=1 Tax=Hebeloma cylindrosporum TaxID=76867 RepID=A0A0C2YAZ6_HEBCY|nr:hypothetical protein M413DRAFT_30311 [Hebeloma cylindrosporum h7]